MGLFNILKPKKSGRQLLLDGISHNADVIERTEGKSRKDAEYLAICTLIDDLSKRPNGRQGYLEVMEILKTRYPEHLNDVITYVGWSTGKLVFKPEFEEALRKRHARSDPQDELVFKNNAGAFEYACKCLNCTISEGDVLPALVKTVDFHTKDGRQSCTLTLVSDEGGREIALCDTLNENVPKLKAGDLVAYKIVGHLPDSKSNISMLSVMGFVVAKLEPVWSPNKGWKVARS
jgi:hypothetical protein